MIEAAVLETARGRWFLVEYDRRRRAAETNQLLEAVIRLERALVRRASPHGAGEAGRLASTGIAAPA
jgi:hypothetical protein